MYIILCPNDFLCDIYLKIRNFCKMLFTVISDEKKQRSQKKDEKNTVKNRTSTRLILRY